MVKRNYGWNLQDPEDYDLCTSRRSGYYDVMNGVDGWVVNTPYDRWVHDGKKWQKDSKSASLRGVAGAVTRKEAQLFAEFLIDEIEGRTSTDFSATM